MRGIIVCLLVLGVAANVHAQQQKFSREVGVPLEAAKAEADKKRWDAALKKLEEAEAVKTRTAHEQFYIDELKAYIYFHRNQYDRAAQIYEKQLESGQATPRQTADKVRALTQIYARQRNHDKTIEYGNRWIKLDPNNILPYELVGQAYFMLGRQQASKGDAAAKKNFTLAAQTIQRAIAINEKAGRKPEQNWLNIQLNSYHALDNDKAVLTTRAKLVRYYPSQDNWRLLLTPYSRQLEDDRAKLNLYRLMLDLGILDDPNDFVEMAQMMMDQEFGIPAEAVNVMDVLLSKNVANNQQRERYLRVHKVATEMAAKTRTTLEEQARLAAQSTDGNADVKLGQLHLSYGENARAIEVIRRGIEKGNLSDPDEARLLLGLAYYRAGQKEEARKAFQAVSNKSVLATVADLWAMRAAQQS